MTSSSTIPYRLNVKPSMMAHMVSLIGKHLQVLQVVVKRIAVLMMHYMPSLEGKIDSHNSPGYFLPITRLDVGFAVSSLEIGSVAIEVAKVVQLFTYPAFGALDGSTTGGA